MANILITDNLVRLVFMMPEMENTEDIFIVAFFVFGIALTVVGIYVFKRFVKHTKSE